MEGYRESKFFNFHVFPRTIHVSSSARRSSYVKVEILNFPRLVKGVRFTFLPLHDDHHMWKPSKVEILKFYVSREVSPYVSSSVHVEAIENRKRVFVLRFFFCVTIIIIRRDYRESKFWISTPRERFRLTFLAPCMWKPLRIEIPILTMIVQKSCRKSKFWISTHREERSSHLSSSVHRESKFLNFYSFSSVSPPFFLSATITVAWKLSRVETLNLRASRRIFILTCF